MVVYYAAVYHRDYYFFGACAALPEFRRAYRRGAPLFGPMLVVRRDRLRLHYVVRHGAYDVRFRAQLFYKFFGRHALRGAHVDDGQGFAFSGSGAGGGGCLRFVFFYRIEVLYDGAFGESQALPRRVFSRCSG